MNDRALPAVLKVEIPSLAMDEGELIAVLQSSIYPGAKVESIKLVIGYCRAQNLDPMLKPVHIVPMDVPTGKKDSNGWDITEKRDVVMPGIGLYRIQAARTNEHVGTSDPDFGPDVTVKLGDTEITYPSWCRVVVKRMKGAVVAEYSATERWTENYATKGRAKQDPNKMWAKRPYAQLAKCAEAQALRKGFPEIGAQPTAEEMEGKSLDDVNGAVIDGSSVRTSEAPRIPPPESRSAAATNGHGGNGRPPEDKSKDTPASEGQLKLIRTKAEAATITEEEILKEFKLEKLDGISVLTGNCILQFLKDPAAYRAPAS